MLRAFKAVFGPRFDFFASVEKMFDGEQNGGKWGDLGKEARAMESQLVREENQRKKSQERVAF